MTKSARRQIESHHWEDANGNPAGGSTLGYGFTIAWQNGPTREQGSDDPVRNGAFVEEVLIACRDRIEFYQRSKYNCEENAQAIVFITRALGELVTRTNAREARGVEGTNVV